ncbi:MAG: purine-nucleoside phosphorylase [Proteobacteria bacterium]|nr:purine-nucleoside phosphorylase [Pseudomonadota bacterium]NDC24115.1 purine-nucleoside phosphorylase [Pseudomonadota bacterium]NDD04146.1 purine-nucleoside phosphorylase [Pseudomonadota bacterium]NDG26364.1 purine-nucleoside phosphorylase [Pseudomonadota bacterium]
MQKLEEAKHHILRKCPDFPGMLIVLGSGLGSLLDDLKLEVEIPFNEIPHFKKATVPGHSGRLVIGTLGKIRVSCLQGRLHYYEGYSMAEVVFPFRVLALCGAETFLLTNAAGGVHSDMNPGDLLLIKDHINCMGDNPLIGANEETLGARFPDMTQVYDSHLRESMKKVAQENGIALREGVYAGVHGPSYETPAEVKMLKMVGADVIGMSTIPEAIALKHMGKKVVAVSCVTNLASGVIPGTLDHAEVLETAKKVQKSFAFLVKEFVHVVRT